MIIRVATTLAEANEVIDLYLGYDRPADPRPTPLAVEESFRKINQSGYVAVAVSDNKIVGSYTMYYCANLARSGKPFAVIENVIIATAHRRQGIGRTLMAHAQVAARDTGCYKVMLCTGANRPENLKFYESCGFIGNKVGFQVRYVS